MIRKTDRPDFENMRNGDIHLWFDDNVQPINDALDNAVEVSGEARQDTDGLWAMHEMVVGEPLKHHKYKALLINIEPIKQETCADVLREVLLNNRLRPAEADRARAALERESE